MSLFSFKYKWGTSKPAGAAAAATGPQAAPKAISTLPASAPAGGDLSDSSDGVTRPRRMLSRCQLPPPAQSLSKSPDGIERKPPRPARQKPPLKSSPSLPHMKVSACAATSSSEHVAASSPSSPRERAAGLRDAAGWSKPSCHKDPHGPFKSPRKILPSLQAVTNVLPSARVLSPYTLLTSLSASTPPSSTAISSTSSGSLTCDSSVGEGAGGAAGVEARGTGCAHVAEGQAAGFLAFTADSDIVDITRSMADDTFSPPPSPPSSPDGARRPPTIPEMLAEEARDAEEDDDYGTVVTMDDGQEVLAGDVDGLIARLTYVYYPDPSYMSTFLLTYRSFTTPAYVLQKLIEIYLRSPKRPECTRYMQRFQRKQTIARLRVCNTLKFWVEHHFYDFAFDQSLIEVLVSFSEQHLDQRLHDRITTIIKRKLDPTMKRYTHVQQTLSMNLQHMTCASDPLEQEPSTSKSLCDFDPMEIAGQLTLMEYKFLRCIHPKEYLNKAWSSPAKAEMAPNILNMIHRSNSIPLSFATLVLGDKSPRERGLLLRHLIHIAQKCRELNNFNAVMEITAGLQLSSIFRLKRTWETVSKRDMALLQELQELMNPSSNWRRFRTELKLCNPPCVPYLGMFLTDLTYVEDGNKNTVTVGTLKDHHRASLSSSDSGRADKVDKADKADKPVGERLFETMTAGWFSPQPSVGESVASRATLTSSGRVLSVPLSTSPDVAGAPHNERSTTMPAPVVLCSEERHAGQDGREGKAGEAACRLGAASLPPDLELINFVKRRKVAAVIREINQYVQSPYSIKFNLEAAEYLMNMKALPENELYDLSLQVEPKEQKPVSEG